MKAILFKTLVAIALLVAQVKSATTDVSATAADWSATNYVFATAADWLVTTDTFTGGTFTVSTLTADDFTIIVSSADRAIPAYLSILLAICVL